jgi:hypothetical protein
MKTNNDIHKNKSYFIYYNIGEIYLCDDGLIPTNGDFNQVSNDIASCD